MWKPLKLKKNIYRFNHNNDEIAYKHIEKDNSKPTILFFYGFGGNIEMVDIITPYLSKEYSVLVVDRSGWKIRSHNNKIQ